MRTKQASPICWHLARSGSVAAQAAAAANGTGTTLETAGAADRGAGQDTAPRNARGDGRGGGGRQAPVTTRGWAGEWQSAGPCASCSLRRRTHFLRTTPLPGGARAAPARCSAIASAMQRRPLAEAGSPPSPRPPPAGGEAPRAGVVGEWSPQGRSWHEGRPPTAPGAQRPARAAAEHARRRATRAPGASPHAAASWQSTRPGDRKRTVEPEGASGGRPGPRSKRRAGNGQRPRRAGERGGCRRPCRQWLAPGHSASRHLTIGSGQHAVTGEWWRAPRCCAHLPGHAAPL